MSKIRDLKTNPENSINIVNIVEMFSPDAKSKYTDMLLRLMKSTPNLKEHTKEIKSEILKEYSFIPTIKLDEFSDLQIMLIWKFIDGFFESKDLQNFRKFCELNERGLVTQNDLSKYSTMEEVMASLSIAEMALDAKLLEKQTKIVYEDSEWLLVRPLTYESSKKYGANTKWCTTQSDNSEYFLKYSSKGVLIYCINKKTGYKVASFNSLDKNDPDFSFWNQKDSRIDSLQTELTDELRIIIKNESTIKAYTNRYLLSDDERTKEDKNYSKSSLKSMVTRSQDIDVMEQPSLIQDGDTSRERYIRRALERAQQEYDNQVQEEPVTEQMLEERAEEESYENRDNIESEGPISYSGATDSNIRGILYGN
jgi:hypothetical protein